MERIIKKATSFKVSFIKLWEKINLIVGYTLAVSLAVVFLFYWPFDKLYFILSLIWGISFFRLRCATVPIKRKSVVIMWVILCFGLSGIIMQVLNVGDYTVLGIATSGIVIMLLYSYVVPVISYKLKYNNCKYGWAYYTGQGWKETKYNGYYASLCIIFITLILSGIADSNVTAEKEEHLLVLQLEQKAFVPVKLIKEEIYNGNTIYILEAEGQRFEVSPFDYPDVRNINSNSQVKVILGDYNHHHLKSVKKIQFKN